MTSRWQTPVLLTTAATSAGLLLIGSYHTAATAPPSATPYVLFWLGLAAGFVPAVLVGTSRTVTDLHRFAAVMTVGVVGSFPKFLRNPTGPLFHDEFAHFRQARLLHETGQLAGETVVVRAADKFPGLHAVVGSFAEATGLNTWNAWLPIGFAAHVAGILGVFVLLRLLARSGTAAFVGAALWATNPNWLFFSAQFSYESVAAPLAIWTLVAAVRTGRSTGAAKVTSASATVVLAAATAVTHHLTAIVVAVLLGTAGALVAFHRSRSTGRWPIWVVVALLTCTTIGGLLALRGAFLIDYLGPSISRGWAGLGTQLGINEPSGSVPYQQRKLFGGSTLPWPEIVAGLVMPVVVGVTYAASMLLARARMHQGGPFGVVLGWFGLGFFVSLPLILTAGGAEGARRSWTWSWLGIAFVVGAAYDLVRNPPSGSAALDPTDRSRPNARARPNARSRQIVRVRSAAVRIVTLVPAVALPVLLVGGVATGVNETYRFPGPYQVGNDARSIDDELLTVVDWLTRNAEPGAKLLADRYVGSAADAYADTSLVSPSPTYPIWDLFFDDTAPGPELASRLGSGRIRFVVVDHRMATQRPGLGYWFTVDEPGRDSDQLISVQALRRLTCFAWSPVVFATTNFTIHKLDLDLYDVSATAAATATVKSSGEC